MAGEFTEENINIGEGDCELQGPNDNDYVNVGACRDAELDAKLKKLFIKDGRYLMPIKSFTVDKEFKFSILLVETHARNLAIALGVDPATIEETSEMSTIKIFGNTIEDIPNFKLKYSIPNVFDKNKKIRFIFNRVEISGDFKLAFSNDKEWVYKLECMALPDSEAAGLALSIEMDKLDA